MKYKLNQLYPAILITPGSYGVTGCAYKHEPLEKFEWTFVFDEPGKPSVGVARQDIYIPQFDKTRWCPAVDNSTMSRTWRNRSVLPGVPTMMAKGMGTLIGKGTFMEELDKVMIEMTKAKAKPA